MVKPGADSADLTALLLSNISELNSKTESITFKLMLQRFLGSLSCGIYCALILIAINFCYIISSKTHKAVRSRRLVNSKKKLLGIPHYIQVLDWVKGGENYISGLFTEVQSHCLFRLSAVSLEQF